MSVGGLRDDPAMLLIRTGSGVLRRRPSKPYVSAAVANLEPDHSIVLERVEEEPGDWYIQVWMRQGNTFQLEYRDGISSEHYQTLTASREKVIAAMLAWMKGERDWREPFMWNNIASLFPDGEPDESVPDACPPTDGSAAGGGDVPEIGSHPQPGDQPAAVVDVSGEPVSM